MSVFSLISLSLLRFYEVDRIFGTVRARKTTLLRLSDMFKEWNIYAVIRNLLQRD